MGFSHWQMTPNKTFRLYPALMKPFCSEAELAEKKLCLHITCAVNTAQTHPRLWARTGESEQGMSAANSPLPWRDPTWQQSRAQTDWRDCFGEESVTEAPAQSESMWDDANNKSFQSLCRDVFQNQLLFMAGFFGFFLWNQCQKWKYLCIMKNYT